MVRLRVQLKVPSLKKIKHRGDECGGKEREDIHSGCAGRAEAGLHVAEAEGSIEGPHIILALHAFDRNDVVLDKVGNVDASRVHSYLERR